MDNVIIEGQGWGTILKATGGATYTIALQGMRGCVLRDMQIDGNASAYCTGHVLIVDGGMSVKI